eukprot:scaffold1019_cov324-Prasinococcus_capsulatus_cf.AAC.4
MHNTFAGVVAVAAARSASSPGPAQGLRAAGAAPGGERARDQGASGGWARRQEGGRAGRRGERLAGQRTAGVLRALPGKVHPPGRGRRGHVQGRRGRPAEASAAARALHGRPLRQRREGNGRRPGRRCRPRQRLAAGGAHPPIPCWPCAASRGTDARAGCMRRVQVQAAAPIDLQAVMVFEHGAAPKWVGQDGVDAHGLLVDRLGVCGEVTLLVHASGNRLQLQLCYNSDLHRDDSATRMLHHLANLLGDCVTHSQTPCRQLSLLDAPERRKVVQEWNSTARRFPHRKLLHQLVEEQAKRTPDATALVMAGDRLSYKDMMSRADQLASKLRQHGVRPGVMVAMLVDRSFEMIIGLLAVLQAGAAYVPIDGGYPVQRIEYILDDTEAPVMLILSSTSHKVRPYDSNIA